VGVVSRLFPLGLESPGPRLRGDASNRSPARLMAVIAEHHHRGSARYAPHDVTGDGKAETFCNLFAQDVAEALGATLPRHTRANELARWLAELGPANHWVHVSESVAQMHADAGGLAVAVWANPQPAKPGHIAVLVPSLGEEGTWLAQAGATNFTRGTVSAGFGPFVPAFYAHQ
jgi:hypothetical protein